MHSSHYLHRQTWIWCFAPNCRAWMGTQKPPTFPCWPLLHQFLAQHSWSYAIYPLKEKPPSH
jgi:hypothetical protein